MMTVVGVSRAQPTDHIMLDIQGSFPSSSRRPLSIDQVRSFLHATAEPQCKAPGNPSECSQIRRNRPKSGCATYSQSLLQGTFRLVRTFEGRFQGFQDVPDRLVKSEFSHPPQRRHNSVHLIIAGNPPRYCSFLSDISHLYPVKYTRELKCHNKHNTVQNHGFGDGHTYIPYLFTTNMTH